MAAKTDATIKEIEAFDSITLPFRSSKGSKGEGEIKEKSAAAKPAKSTTKKK